MGTHVEEQGRGRRGWTLASFHGGVAWTHAMQLLVSARAVSHSHLLLAGGKTLGLLETRPLPVFIHMDRRCFG
jgi:hypothetical protein